MTTIMSPSVKAESKASAREKGVAMKHLPFYHFKEDPIDGVYVNATIADNMLKARAARDVTVTHVAEQLGVSPKVYSKWERAEHPIPAKSLWLVARVLGVSLHDLLDGLPNAGAKTHSQS